MNKLFLYNTLTKRKEEFKPIKTGLVGIYACGPTVYNYAHIGNLRTYLFEDFLRRTLLYNGYKLKHIINITDVGHLTGDADMGEDKMEAGAKREGKSAWEIAEFYTIAFKKDIKYLNILEPEVWCRATDTIFEQIALIKKLEKNGYTYQTSDGLYFDTAKVKKYNKLSHLPLETLKEGARVEKNPEKKNPTDFALWKFSPQDKKRQMEWSSPWGKGFPGWHIECSAMSLKYLKNNLDIHCGGIDHINVHHTNEIAQSEAATGKKFFNFWLHGAFLNISGGKKMAKSDNNFLTLEKAILEHNISPLAYRFLACQVHYRKPMEYSLASLKQAAGSLSKLQSQVQSYFTKDVKKQGQINLELKEKFLRAINDDLNIPKALAVVAAVIKSSLSSADKWATITDFDQVLGLDLGVIRKEKKIKADSQAQALLFARNQARADKNFIKADRLRDELKALGYIIEDTNQGSTLKLLKK